MTVRRCVVAALVALMGFEALAAAPEVDLKETKEWKALNRFAGSWILQSAVAAPGGAESRRVETIAWTLGDRFLQSRSKSDTDKSEDLFLSTYDADRRAIRCWWFNSSGQTGVASGTWDEATSTLTLKVENVAPRSCTITDRLVDADHREGKVVFKDGDGKVFYEASSKATRQKKK